MTTFRLAMANIRFPATPDPDGVVLAYQPYGQEGLLVADIDLTRATGLLARRCRTGP